MDADRAQRRAEIQRLWATGLRPELIAGRLGISRSAVDGVARRLDLTPQRKRAEAALAPALPANGDSHFGERFVAIPENARNSKEVQRRGEA